MFLVSFPLTAPHRCPADGTPQVSLFSCFSGPADLNPRCCRYLLAESPTR